MLALDVSSVKPCAICSEVNQKVELLYRLPDYDVLTCRNCGLIYVNQVFEGEKGEGIPEGYDSIYLPAERSFLARFESNIQAMEEFAKGDVYRFSRKTITMLLKNAHFEVGKIQAGENPPFRLYLSKRNFRQNWLVKIINYIVFAPIFAFVKLTGFHSRMVVYARKA